MTDLNEALRTIKNDENFRQQRDLVEHAVAIERFARAAVDGTIAEYNQLVSGMMNKQCTVQTYEFFTYDGMFPERNYRDDRSLPWVLSGTFLKLASIDERDLETPGFASKRKEAARTCMHFARVTLRDSARDRHGAELKAPLFVPIDNLDGPITVCDVVESEALATTDKA